jgi:hypothetical protein
MCKNNDEVYDYVNISFFLSSILLIKYNYITMRNLIILILFIGVLSVDPENDEILDWPLYPPHNFKTYNGFVETYAG